MPLSTYAELQAGVASFLNRDDLTATIPTFIALAEAQMQRDVRHWRMENRATAPIDGRYCALPGDWVETKRLALADGTELRLVSTATMAMVRSRDDSGTEPRFYAHVAGEIEVYPSPGEATTLEIVYVSRIAALTDEAPTNWLLAEAPDAYLYGALMATAPYLSDDARISVWASLYAAAVAALNARGEAAQWSGRGLVMR